MVLAIFGNPYQGSHRTRLHLFFEALATGIPGVRFLFERSFHDWLRSRDFEIPAGAGTIGKENFEADMCLSFGGDGTFLHTARRVGASGIPVMGINTGHLGYLTTAGITDPQAAADIIIHGSYHIEERSMLRATVANGEHSYVTDALNEIAVTKQDTASMIEIRTHVNGIRLADYRADGLIISTPTGSTGYSLSVGGPVASPSTGIWIISPIAAHALTMRPLVVPDRTLIDMTVASRSGSFLLSADGVSKPFRTGVGIRVERAPYVTRIVTAEGHTFVDTLRDKLSWGI